MVQLLIRNLDAALVKKLKSRAAQNGRSLQGEVKTILENSVQVETSDFWVQATRLRQTLADRPQSDSAELLREDRRR